MGRRRRINTWRTLALPSFLYPHFQFSFSKTPSGSGYGAVQKLTNISKCSSLAPPESFQNILLTITWCRGNPPAHYCKTAISSKDTAHMS